MGTFADAESNCKINISGEAFQMDCRGSHCGIFTPEVFEAKWDRYTCSAMIDISVFSYPIAMKSSVSGGLFPIFFNFSKQSNTSHIKVTLWRDMSSRSSRSVFELTDPSNSIK